MSSQGVVKGVVKHEEKLRKNAKCLEHRIQALK